ncbi:hypothetical protein D7X94_09680 [Acutalibacter sp. 1XD8-33]|uniref:LPD28 domain-containing protein n=1 Tax=Acutalibacter sp. 1XD8-33 TaxID=2320081 RepID=UPI000EA40B0F|nr:LPD28 domain-containing protein [Acutalibacter sp. 1XD8-33]RKJ40123.1 hypothetical protein D7X94_09680 [Acutalibacter sp. 1XD8-33]
MTMINAALTPMQEVEIFGYPALFTPNRVSRDTVHMLFCYEMQVAAKGRPFALVERAKEKNFFGTVLTPVPVEIEKGRKPVRPGDFVSDPLAASYTPAIFEQKYMAPAFGSAERFGKEG